MIVCYDLAISPPSFDCISFVLHVNGLKRNDDLKILISPGPRDGFRPDNCWPRETEIRKKLLDGIVVPACKMVGSVEVLNEPIDKDVYGAGRRRYGIEFLVEEFKRGNRSLRPLQALPKNDNLITITLREAEHWPERNSDVAEWIKVARELSCYRVVFIRDTAKVDDPFDYETDRLASIDLDYRGALYRSAFCNLFANNGPAWFCFAIDAPAIVCKLVTGNGEWCYSENFWRHYGIRDQFPGSPPYQRVTYDTDKADIILREFEKWSLTNA